MERPAADSHKPNLCVGMRGPQFLGRHGGCWTNAKVFRKNVDRHDIPHLRGIKVPRDLLCVNLVTAVGNLTGRIFVS